jgi:hypothetical protein
MAEGIQLWGNTQEVKAGTAVLQHPRGCIPGQAQHPGLTCYVPHFLPLQDILLETYAKEFKGNEDVELHIITKEAFEKVRPLGVHAIDCNDGNGMGLHCLMICDLYEKVRGHPLLSVM